MIRTATIPTAPIRIEGAGTRDGGEGAGSAGAADELIMQAQRAPLRIAVIGHVEHVTLGRVPALPAPGDIVHLDEPLWIPGGGGGVAFFQLVRSPAEVHLFTAIGNDSGGSAIAERIQATGAAIHAVRRPLPHTRDVVLVTPGGERTIVVIGKPLQPQHEDPLPWDLLGTCAAAYFTARDPPLIRAARAARVLVVSARRAGALVLSGVAADVVVGSGLDPAEASSLADYPVPPRALVTTEGAAGGRIETRDGHRRFAAPPSPPPCGTAYGAGDSFAAALTWYLACGLALPEACTRAAAHGAAVLRGVSPLESQLDLEWPEALEGRADPDARTDDEL